MLKDNLLKYGVLRCRDLVELYYGARMVATLLEGGPNFTGGVQFHLLSQDPRRIAYEIIIANPDATPYSFSLGTPASFDAGTNQTYEIPAHDEIIIERSFLTGLDSVTMAVDGNLPASLMSIATREIFLTPAPVDEVPLG